MAIKLYKSQLEPTTVSSNVESKAFASMEEAASIGKAWKGMVKSGEKLYYKHLDRKTDNEILEKNIGISTGKFSEGMRRTWVEKGIVAAFPHKGMPRPMKGFLEEPDGDKWAVDFLGTGITYEHKNYYSPYLIKTVSNPPIVYREGSSILASRNSHSINFGNEIGHQIDLNSQAIQLPLALHFHP